MNHFRSQLLIYSLLIGLVFHISNRCVMNLTELDACPFCYGEDYCSEMKNNVSLTYRSFSDVIFNLISVKNVYFATNGNSNIVIKKLADHGDFVKLNKHIFNRFDKMIKVENILELLTEKHRNFQVCDVKAANLLLQKFSFKNLTHLWTLLNVNVEPLLLEVFRQEEKWPIPKLFGYCGRTAIIENCGIPLNDIQTFDWYSRAYVALQLLSASEKFTSGHQEFRLYLTDISPDNIVVDPQKLKISFIDLEHGILQKKVVETTYHYTEHRNEEYGFFTEEICDKDISDHNVYAVCRLLLSPSSPWPMMHKGLLHSPPPSLDTKDLFEHIQLCVEKSRSFSRFFHSIKIRELLYDLLKNVNYFALNADSVSLTK